MELARELLDAHKKKTKEDEARAHPLWQEEEEEDNEATAFF